MGDEVSTYTLYFTQTISTSVTVEADDFDSAVDAAYDSDAMPPGSPLCAQCGGWGHPWSIDTSDDWVLDESGYEVDGQMVDVADGAR